MLQEDITFLHVSCIATEHQNTWQKPVRAATRNRLIHYYSWRFSILLLGMDRSNKQKISKDIVQLNSTIDQLVIMDIYRLLHSTKADYTLFSSSHGTFAKIDHILGHIPTNLKEQKTYNVISHAIRELNLKSVTEWYLDNPKIHGD